MSRLVLTLLTGLLLLAAYAAYAVVMRPLTTMQPAVVLAPPPAEHASVEPLHEAARMAREHLAAWPWAAVANNSLRTEQGYAYFNEYHPDLKGGVVEFRPFAMIWQSHDRSKPPVTVVCDRAAVRFQRGFDLKNLDPGRVVEAKLLGEVQLRGPNDMSLNGREFYFDESALELYSSRPVSFEMGPHRGESNRVQIKLLPASVMAPDDRPAVGGLEKIRFTNGLTGQFELKQGTQRNPIKIRCTGLVEYLPGEMVATFQKPDGPASRRDVRVWQEPAAGQLDKLECDLLVLHFAPRHATSTPAAGISNLDAPIYQPMETDLELKSLRAEGDELKISSTGHHIQGTLRQLTYDAQERRLDLRMAGHDRLKQRENELRTPHVTARFGAEGEIQEVLCRGPGQIESRNDQHVVQAVAEWQDLLRQSFDAARGWDRLDLQGQAQFRQSQAEAALAANRISVWLAPLPRTGVARSNTPGASTGISQIDPKRLEAHEHVAFLSPKIDGDTESLVVDFIPAPTTVTVQSAGAKQGAQGPSPDEADSQQFTVKAQALALKLSLGTKGVAPRLSQLQAEGGVEVSGADRGRTGLLKGEVLRLDETSAGAQSLVVLGTPPQRDAKGPSERFASLAGGDYAIHGYELHLEPKDNRAWVAGPGKMAMMVRRSLQGEALPSPEPMTVAWGEGMEFDGLTATFTEQVRAELGGASMDCARMDVLLNQRVRFDVSRSPITGKIEPAKLTCRGRVNFANQTLSNTGVLMNVQRGQVGELIILQQSGDVTAQGPGWIQMWKRQSKNTDDTTERGVVRPASMANRPQSLAGDQWDYTRVDFARRMDGNTQRKTTRFSERVVVIHGPTARPVDVIDRDDLPERAGWMSCKELELAQVEGKAKSANAPVELQATGNVQLEGNFKQTLFSGIADRVTYDQSRDMYVLLGEGFNAAEISSQSAPGATPNGVKARRLEFLPSLGKFNAHQVIGADGGR